MILLIMYAFANRQDKTLKLLLSEYCIFSICMSIYHIKCYVNKKFVNF